MTDGVQRPRDLTDRIRRHIYWANGIIWFLLFTCGAWVISGVYALFGFDLFGYLNHQERNRAFCVATYTALAIVAPIGTAIMAWVLIRRALHLARYGTEVTAKVTGTWGLSLRIEYVIGSQTYKTRVTLPKVVAGDFLDGTKPLVLIVDPRKPKRFMMKHDVFPDQRNTPDFDA